MICTICATFPQGLSLCLAYATRYTLPALTPALRLAPHFFVLLFNACVCFFCAGGVKSYGPVLVTGGGDSAVIIWEVSRTQKRGTVLFYYHTVEKFSVVFERGCHQTKL